MGAYASVIVDQNVPISMRDGVTLYADIYRPDTRDKVPVLLQRTPYDKTQRSGSVAVIDPIRAAAAGYSVVIQDVRGRYASEGAFYPFRHETDDGVDTVEWCASQPWSTGKVGMYGRSYVGATQWLAAIGAPPHLAALAPGITSSTYHEGWTYQGGAFELAFAGSWATSQLTLGNLKKLAAQVPGAEADKELLIDAVDNLHTALRHLPLKEYPPLKRPGLAPYYYDWLAHPSDDDYWRVWKIEAQYEQVAVPALHYGGWYDIFLGGTLKNYLGMQERGGTPQARHGQKLLIGPWAHVSPFSNGVGQVDFGLRANPLSFDMEGLQLRWFDHWLKEEENGVTEEPPVRIFVMGLNRWRDEFQWPPEGITYVNYYLHSGGRANTLNGEGTLSPERPGDEPPDSYVYNPRDPVPTRGGNLCCYPVLLAAGAFDQREIEARADVLVYSTPPLNRDTEVTGPLTVTLYASSSAPDTDFTAKLVDVCECGSTRNLADGIIRARYRESLAQPKLIQPGQVYKYTIDLWATSNLFKKGHRIRVEISSSNYPRFDPNPNTGEPFGESARVEPALQQVYHNAAGPSHITLPILER